MASITDRWHKSRPRPDEAHCDHDLVPSADHGKGARWQVRWRDENGEQCGKNFERKTGKNPDLHADAFLAKLVAESNAGTWIDPRGGQIPFKEYAKTWVDGRLLRDTSTQTYWHRLNKHVIPVFGHLPLAAIKPTRVQAWVKRLSEENDLAPNTVKQIYVIFASIMRGAVKDDLIRKTPCQDIALPDIEATEVVLLTPTQIRALADAMAEVAPHLELLIWLGVGLGLRQGEAFGLALDRIAFLKRDVTVDQQVILVGGQPRLATVKTKASKRHVPLPPSLGRKISAHLTACGEGTVLCTTASGTLVTRTWFNDDIWAKARTKAGLPEKLTFHDLRHTFASEALARGVPISDLSKWLGHKSIKTTVDIYGHLLPEADTKIRGVMDDVITEADKSDKTAGDGAAVSGGRQ